MNKSNDCFYAEENQYVKLKDVLASIERHRDGLMKEGHISESFAVDLTGALIKRFVPVYVPVDDQSVPKERENSES